jgi:hypothetical protein
VIKNLTDAHAPRIAISNDGIATIVAQVEPENIWRIAAFSHANPALPVNLTLPKVSASGAIKAGATLSCDHGTWTASPTSYRYEWLLDGTATGPPADASTLKLTASQIGKKISCRVTAINQNGTGIATSAALDTGSANGTNAKVASIKAKADKVTVKISCPAGGSSCPVTVTLSVPKSGGNGKASAAKAKKKSKGLVVGRASAKAKPGTSKTITVGLNKVGKKLLAKRHKLPVTVTVSAGKAVLKHASVVLKPKKKRR